MLNNWIGIPYLLNYIDKRCKELDKKILNANNEMELEDLGLKDVKIELLRLKINLLKYQRKGIK
jgi:hypothetical protein